MWPVRAALLKVSITRVLLYPSVSHQPPYFSWFPRANGLRVVVGFGFVAVRAMEGLIQYKVSTSIAAAQTPTG